MSLRDDLDQVQTWPVIIDMYEYSIQEYTSTLTVVYWIMLYMIHSHKEKTRYFKSVLLLWTRKTS